MRFDNICHSIDLISVQNVLISAIELKGSICYRTDRTDGADGWDGRDGKRQEKTGKDGKRQDRPYRHLNLTFHLTCDGQLSQFLRCFLTWELFYLLKRNTRPATCKDSNKLSSKSWKTKSFQSLFCSFSDQAERRSKSIFGDDSEHWIPFKSHHCWHSVCKYRADLNYINIAGGESDQAGTPKARIRMFRAVSFFSFLLALAYGWSAEHLKMHLMFRKLA